MNNWFDSVRAYILNYHAWLTEVAVLGGTSFLIGFLLKNFGKYLIGATMIAVLTIVGLQHVGIITISLGEIATTLGLPEVHTTPDLLKGLVDWAQVHVLGSLSIIFGFIIGWTIG